MQNQTLKVEGMSCNHCVNSIEGALRNIGVTAKVDLKKMVQFRFSMMKITLILRKSNMKLKSKAMMWFEI